MSIEKGPNIYANKEQGPKTEKEREKPEVKHELEENICDELREEVNKEAREMLESEDDITLLEKVKKKGKMAAAVGLVGLTLVSMGCEAEEPRGSETTTSETKQEQVIDQKQIEERTEELIKELVEKVGGTEEQFMEAIGTYVELAIDSIGEWREGKNIFLVETSEGNHYEINKEDMPEFKRRMLQQEIIQWHNRVVERGRTPKEAGQNSVDRFKRGFYENVIESVGPDKKDVSVTLDWDGNISGFRIDETSSSEKDFFLTRGLVRESSGEKYKEANSVNIEEADKENKEVQEENKSSEISDLEEEKVTDKSALKELVKSSEDTNMESYASKSKNEIKEALEEAKEVLEDEEATQDEVDQAHENLDKATENPIIGTPF